MKLVLGIPVVYVVPGQTFPSLLAFAASIGRRGEIIVPEVLNVFPYDRARELVMEVAEKHEADYVMFVDSDMVIPSNALDLLLEGIQAGGRIVSGYHYKRGYPYSPTWFKIEDKTCRAVTAAPDVGYQELDAAGMACSLIDFKWLQKNLERPFFSMRAPTGKECAEDVLFCWRVTCAGGKVLGDPRVRCGHLGPTHVVDDGSVEFLRNLFLQGNPSEEVALRE